MNSPAFLLSIVSAVACNAGSVQAVYFTEVKVAGKQVTACRVDPKKEKLQLFLKDDQGVPLKSFDAINGWLAKSDQQLLFAMNAGMYHGDMSPVGLFVTEGRQISPLNLREAEGNFFLKPNGVFLVTDQGAKVIESSEYPRHQQGVILATQSGPLLLRDGVIHPKFNATSISRLYRNGVGVRPNGEVIFAISEETVNFYEFATMFRDILGCPNALFFDGTVSSLYSTKLKRNDRRMDLGPIIGIVQPK